MDRDEYIKFLKTRNLSKEEIDQSIRMVASYEAYLESAPHPRSLAKSTREDILSYSKTMIEAGSNSYEHYVALARYGLSFGNNALYTGVLELLDGAEVLDNLYHKVAQEVGDERRDAIFSGVDKIPLGTPNSEKPAVMQPALERLERGIDLETREKIVGSGLRDLQEDWYVEERNKYQGCQDIDQYLDQKGEEFISQLENIKASGKLFFNQEITDEVIEFVDRIPEIRQGVREGNIIYEIKIPHMSKEYLAEQDEIKKRYYYCHCPWVKESLKSGKSGIPSWFCNCSAAFHKKPWEVIFGQSLHAEIIESVLQGDLWCRIAIHLPVESEK
jgi:hypothetical protein